MVFQPRPSVSTILLKRELIVMRLLQDYSTLMQETKGFGC